MESPQSFSITSCLHTKIAWFDVIDSAEDENVPQNCTQSPQASPKHQKHKGAQAKGKDVK